MWQRNWFSFYNGYSGFVRWAFSNIPFSAGDLCYLILTLFLLFKLYRLLRILFKKEINFQKKAQIFLRYLLKFSIVIVLFYFFFMFSWGFNYQFRSFANENKLTASAIKRNEIDSLCYFLLRKATSERQLIYSDSNKQQLNFSSVSEPSNILLNAKKIYLGGLEFIKLKPTSKLSLKPSLFGFLMNYLGVSGYFNPFTGEAQVNTYIPLIELPFTSCHELAHESGYGYEYEANLIGYLASSSSNDLKFKYSAHTQALLYALPIMKSLDSVNYKKLLHTMPADVKKDLRNEILFWNKFNGPIETLSSIFYTQYLKANRQPQGMESYSDFIPLLIAWYKDHGILSN